jgi:hypothetical protein
MATIEQLALTVLERNEIEARSLAQEILRTRVSTIAAPNRAPNDVVLIMAAALAELLASYQGVAPPSWTAQVGAMPQPLDLLPARHPKLREELLRHVPEPLRRRDILAPEDFLHAV